MNRWEEQQLIISIALREAQKRLKDDKSDEAKSHHFQKLNEWKHHMDRQKLEYKK